MSSPNLADLQIGEELVTAIVQLFGAAGIPCLLHGDYALNLYGAPISVPRGSFTVPDHQIPAARTILTDAHLTLCTDPNCFLFVPPLLPRPDEHFHLDRHATIFLYRLSYSFPNLVDLATPQAGLMSAGDPSLPLQDYTPEESTGNGRFAPLTPVRIPAPVCNIEAAIRNFLRENAKHKLPNPPEFDSSNSYLNEISYTTQYALKNGIMSLDSFPPAVKTFLVEGFIDDGKPFAEAEVNFINSWAPAHPL